MVYRIKIRIKTPGDPVGTDARRDKVLDLLTKHGGKNGTPNPRAHVVGVFCDRAAAKAFKTEARGFLAA